MISSGKLVVPDPSLVVLIGPSGAGKSTFARAHFLPTEIVSADVLRAMLANDPNDQRASAEAFRILALLVVGRLRRRLLTVVDATNLRRESRRGLQRIAAQQGVPTAAIAFDLPTQLVRMRNAQRPDRQVDERVIRDQIHRLGRALVNLPNERFDRLYVLREPETLGLITVERQHVPR